MRQESFDQYNAGDTGWTMATTQWRFEGDGQMVVVGGADAITGPRSLSLQRGLGTGTARAHLDFAPASKGFVSAVTRAQIPNTFDQDGLGYGFMLEDGNVHVGRWNSRWRVTLFHRGESRDIIINDPAIDSAPILTATLCLDLRLNNCYIYLLDSEGNILAESEQDLGTFSMGLISSVYVGFNSDIYAPDSRESIILDNLICDVRDDLENVPCGPEVIDVLPVAPEAVTAEIFSLNGDYTFGWQIMARTGPGPNDMVRTATVDQSGIWGLDKIGGDVREIVNLNLIARANATEGEAIYQMIFEGDEQSGKWNEVQTYGTFIYYDVPVKDVWKRTDNFDAINWRCGFSLPA